MQARQSMTIGSWRILRCGIQRFGIGKSQKVQKEWDLIRASIAWTLINRQFVLTSRRQRSHLLVRQKKAMRSQSVAEKKLRGETFVCHFSLRHHTMLPQRIWEQRVQMKVSSSSYIESRVLAVGTFALYLFSTCAFYFFSTCAAWA